MFTIFLRFLFLGIVYNEDLFLEKTYSVNLRIIYNFSLINMLIFIPEISR